MGGDTTPAATPPGTLLPPTRPNAPVTAAPATGGAPLPPFVGGRPRAAVEPPIWVPPADDPANVGPVPPPPELDEPQPIGFGHSEPGEPAGADEPGPHFRLESSTDDDATPLVPQFPLSAAAHGDDEEETDDFPLDAFIVPEGALGPRADEPDAARRLDQVADRLADIAFELRANGSAALQNRLHHGDPLDVVVAAVIAGYLAGLDGR